MNSKMTTIGEISQILVIVSTHVSCSFIKSNYFKSIALFNKEVDLKRYRYLQDSFDSESEEIYAKVICDMSR